jgi:hypothetical protein
MGRGILAKLRANLEQAGKELPDTWRDGHDLKYHLLDAVKCAFAVFFFQHPSLLNFQQEMQRKLKRNNLETLLEVREIPCTIVLIALDGGVWHFSWVADGMREEFFNGLKFSLRRFLHKSWEDFMLFVIGDEDDG